MAFHKITKNIPNLFWKKSKNAGILVEEPRGRAGLRLA